MNLPSSGRSVGMNGQRLMESKAHLICIDLPNLHILLHTIVATVQRRVSVIMGYVGGIAEKLENL